MQIIKNLLTSIQLTVIPISGAKSPDPAQDNQASINKAARDAGRSLYWANPGPPRGGKAGVAPLNASAWGPDTELPD